MCFMHGSKKRTKISKLLIYWWDFLSSFQDLRGSIERLIYNHNVGRGDRGLMVLVDNANRSRPDDNSYCIIDESMNAIILMRSAKRNSKDLLIVGRINIKTFDITVSSPRTVFNIDNTNVECCFHFQWDKCFASRTFTSCSLSEFQL